MIYALLLLIVLAIPLIIGMVAAGLLFGLMWFGNKLYQWITSIDE